MEERKILTFREHESHLVTLQKCACMAHRRPVDFGAKRFPDLLELVEYLVGAVQ